MDKIDPHFDLEYSVSDMVDDEENGPVLESNEEDSEYDELRLEDNLGADICKESRNIADDCKLLENASCLEILALKDIDLEMIGIELSWPTEISISEIAISLIDTIIRNTVFNITIFSITIFNITISNITIFSNTIFSMISLDRDCISRYPGDEIEISLEAGLAPAIMRVISVIIQKAIGVPDILLLHDGRTRDEIVSSRDEIVISQD